MNPLDANNHRFVARLRQEVEAWRRDGAITDDQALAILARYPESAPGFEASRRQQPLIVALSILGAVLIGLGVISFYAANWDEISRSAKLASLIIGTLLSYGAGYYLWQRTSYSAVGVALVLQGCIIYGAGIHLIGQIYHVDVNDPNLSLFWFLGVAPLAYVTRSRPVMFLAVVLFLAAVAFRLQDWLDRVEDSEAVIAGAALYIALGAFLFAVGKAKRLLDGWESIGGLFQAIGLVTVFLPLYMLTFHDLFDGVESISDARFGYWALAYGASAVAIAVTAWLAWRRAQRGDRPLVDLAEVAAIVVLLGVAHAAGLVPVDWDPFYPIVFNALFALSALGLMASGYLQEHEARVNFSLALIAVYLVTRYFEFSIDLLDSALVFVGAGVLLLLGGYLLDRGRRRMLASMREREVAP